MNLTTFPEDVAKALEVDASDLKPGFVLSDSPAWDSLGLVSVMTLVDRHFKRFLNYMDVYECTTYGDLLKLVEK
jgi:acyl carrier protein